jgi:membrane protease YdiL (CAAX protease family)
MNPLPVAPSPAFSLEPVRASKVSGATWIGLFLSLFGMLIVRQLVNHYWPTPTFGSAALKEAGMWLVAGLLLLIIKAGEGLPLSSIGFSTARLGKSILWGFLLGIVCLVVAGGLIALTGYTGGEAGKAFEKLPTWLLVLIVVRAGVVEELCYRGYAIERLHALGLPRSLAAGVPLIIFGVGHWTGGWSNIVIALVLGAILALYFLWRRDLIANMVGHWFVDFVGNVVPRLMP